MWKSEGWKLTNDNYPQSLYSPWKKKDARSITIHSHTSCRHSTPTSTKANPQENVEAPGPKIMTTTTALPLPVPRLKQCTLSGYSSEMPSNKFTVKVAPKKNSEFKLLVEGRTACLILKRLWPRNSWLCLLGNWTMVRVPMYWSQWILQWTSHLQSSIHQIPKLKGLERVNSTGKMRKALTAIRSTSFSEWIKKPL